jgi:hypothetical protein
MKVSQFMVIQRLLGVALQKKPADEHFYASLVSEFKKETKRLIQLLPQLISTREKDGFLSWYCRHYQDELVKSIDDVVAHLPVKERQHLKRFNPVYTSTDWLKTICNCLEEIVLAMQEHFAPYLNMEKMLPDSFQENAVAGMKQNMELIKHKLNDAGIDPELWNIISHQLNHLVSTGSGGSDVTAPKLVYLRLLYDRLTRLLTQHKDKVFEALMGILMHMNFNDSDCCLYIKALIIAGQENIIFYKDKRMNLYVLRKIIDQAPVRKHTYFEPNEPDLKTELERFVKREIIHLNRIIQEHNSDILPADFIRWLKFKVFFNGSIYELGYSLNMMIENDYFLNEDKNEVAEFFSFFSRTIDKSDIEASSLNRKFYTPRASTVLSVRDGLRKLEKFTHKKK